MWELTPKSPFLKSPISSVVFLSDWQYCMSRWCSSRYLNTIQRYCVNRWYLCARRLRQGRDCVCVWSVIDFYCFSTKDWLLSKYWRRLLLQWICRTKTFIISLVWHCGCIQWSYEAVQMCFLQLLCDKSWCLLSVWGISMSRRILHVRWIS